MSARQSLPLPVPSRVGLALVGLLTVALSPGCRSTATRQQVATTAPMAHDQHSHARPTEVQVRHVTLDLTADFGQETLRGSASLQLVRSDLGAAVVLDVGDGLVVDAVSGPDDQPLPFALGAADPLLGAPLSIPLAGVDGDTITVHYHTTPASKAVQWLDPEQTAGGVHPFLYTQGQAILTRTWIPLQDSPGVRVTYDATIHAPTELTALMSAAKREVTAPGTTRFVMDRPIAPYLIALAIGDLSEREISPRCAVWAEPKTVERARAEFRDVGDMLATCEQLYGTYTWGRYDILVLPPAFPFGGMENPCLTFATPTILAGDRSLVALIAHELAHSWSGNLVTNATWADFWLNEGFTVYVEGRIVEALYGKERAAQETINSLSGLRDEIAELPESDQILHLDLTGRDPDDGMTAIAYDKGAAFLRRLEQIFGRERFDAFLAKWFAEHAFQSVTTAEFLTFLDRELLAADPQRAARIDVHRWVKEPGLPEDCPVPESRQFDAVDAARNLFLSGGDVGAIPFDAWTTAEALRFLGEIPVGTAAERLDALDARFHLTDSGNSEILAAWLEIRIRAGLPLPEAVAGRLESFLTRVGRRKFLTPLYRALNEAGPEGEAEARRIYAIARPRYHAVSRGTLDTLLDWTE